jgi:hypothetical protein
VRLGSPRNGTSVSFLLYLRLLPSQKCLKPLFLMYPTRPHQDLPLDVARTSQRPPPGSTHLPSEPPAGASPCVQLVFHHRVFLCHLKSAPPSSLLFVLKVVDVLIESPWSRWSSASDSRLKRQDAESIRPGAYAESSPTSHPSPSPTDLPPLPRATPPLRWSLLSGR